MTLINIKTPERTSKIKNVISFRQKDLTLILDNVHDPHNVSAIYRSCDAFGVPCVHLYYTYNKFPKLGAKSSASARKWVTTIKHNSIEDIKTNFENDNYFNGLQILATNCSSKAKPLNSFDLTKPTVFVLGNEHSGVSKEVFEFATDEVYIPMYGMIQSFNVSVAAAILLAEASRQRISSGSVNKHFYSDIEQENMFNDWIER